MDTAAMELVTLNVGGTMFEITNECLKSFPETRLSNLSSSSPEFIKERKQYFFNRNPEVFNSILDLYRTGSLHLPTNICGATLRNELEFWEIPIEHLSECCIKTYFKYDSDVEKVEEINRVFGLNDTGYSEEECQNSKWTRFKRNVWVFMDQPTSSLPAKMFGVLFMLVVSLSVVINAMETVPEFRQQIYTDEELKHLKNISGLPSIYNHIDLENEKMKWSVNSFLVDWIYYLEICFFTFFTLEFIVHFSFCPNKITFFCNFLNSLDAILCVTMWTILILYHAMDKDYANMLSNKYTGFLFMVSVCITALRLLKIFRFLKNFPGLHLLYMSIKWNIKDLVILFLTFISICCLFGITIYVCEFYEKTTFPNIFIGIWWAVITMTTVGYGDFYPKSVPGYIVGIVCAIWGMMFLAMPIALLSSSFNEYFKRYNDRKRFHAYKNSQDVFCQERMDISTLHVCHVPNT